MATATPHAIPKNAPGIAAIAAQVPAPMPHSIAVAHRAKALTAKTPMLAKIPVAAKAALGCVAPLHQPTVCLVHATAAAQSLEIAAMTLSTPAPTKQAVVAMNALATLLT